MPDKQQDMINNIESLEKSLTEVWNTYWREYSSFDSLQFWVNAALLIVPLILLFFTIDRKRAFLLGFYGFCVHFIFTYIDAYNSTHGKVFYPYKVFPILPSSFTLDVSLIPVVFMLTYQWTLNRNKNYYLYNDYCIGNTCIHF
ncbi:CBO0543 family protein [Bacillus sp. FJAT-18017]|uniref:CBO0543 family protein n=1 Tax=Bacillus sp. FJAT-18017 TaxID=1705566 RepID=UPI0006AE2459|nr:CBO0543 family protein [Bacillus sp. FJAT-18017]